jgi:hypothetical protein
LDVHRKELREKTGNFIDFAQELFFRGASPVNPFYFSGRALVFLVIFFRGWKFVFSLLRPTSLANLLCILLISLFMEQGILFLVFLDNEFFWAE